MTVGPASVDHGLATRMAELAIANIRREYPNAPGHLLRSAEDLRAPRDLHPAFFGSYDWHSSVHQHWLLVRLLRLRLLPAPATVATVRAALTASLDEERLAVEAAYLRDHPAFERTYGWAWLLALAAEVAALAHADGHAVASGASDAIRWSSALEPAVLAVRANWMAFLPRATYPIRAGTHANSAFGLTLALDQARAAGDAAFAEALEGCARAWFADDRDCPAHLEPGGDDFLSSALSEAALMSRVLGDGFADWFRAFLPDPPRTILEPASVTDRADPKLAHLDGLNLSRAWCWRTVAERLAMAPGAEPAIRTAADAADRPLAAAMPHLFSGEYVGEHWVTTFALLALTTPAPR